MKVSKVGHKAPQHTNAADRLRPPIAERPIRTAAYIRVSSDSDDQENSYEAQERYYAGILSSNPMLESAGIYFDNGVTGTSCKERIGFQRLMRHCREGKIDRIICKSISRFARNAQDFITAVRELQVCGVTVYFETAGFDTSDPSTELLLTVLSALAQEESLSISQNIRDGLEHHYPLGEVRNIAIYGYRYNGKMTCTESGYRYRDVDVVDEEAKVVRQIFQSVKEGRTFTDIARDLNRDNIPAPQNPAMKNVSKLKPGLDEGWTGTVISRLVRNERYAGDVLIRKSFTEDALTHKHIRNKGQVGQYLISDHHVAIINREMFKEVQEILKKKNKSQGCCHRTFRPLSGVLVCGECGRNYNVRNTKLAPIWFCPTAERRNGKLTCYAEKLYERDVNEAVKKTVMEKMHAQTSHSAGYGTYYPKRQPALPLMQQEFIEKMYEDMRVSLEDCGLEKQYTELKRRLAEAEDTESLYARQIQKEIRLLEEARSRNEASRANREHAVKWLFELPGGDERWSKFLDGLSGEHLKAFFELITVYQGGRFVFRWFDGTVTEVFQK